MRFFLAHQIEGRTRLRCAQRPVDPLGLAAVADALAGQPGIEALDVRLNTGSLVIEHPALHAEQLVERVHRAGGEIEVAQAQPPLDTLAPVRQTMGYMDNILGGVSAGGLDIRSLAFLVFFSLGITQLLRGQVMMPAFSFLWYAFELANRSPAGPAGPDEPGAGE